MGFDLFVLAASMVAAGVASITGFGVGSILTPVIGLVADTKIAVAAVAIPHLTATLIRFVKLRHDIDRRALWRFGLPSAIGGLTGALLQGRAATPWLTVLFGSLLVFVAASEVTGLARRMAFQGRIAWTAGALSGLLGGLVGNQGGIRSAALMGFDLPKQAFVATATAAGLIVDGARLPVYLVAHGSTLESMRGLIGLATIGAAAGTFAGSRLLSRIPDSIFRPLVAALLAVLGLAMLMRGIRSI